MQESKSLYKIYSRNRLKIFKPKKQDRRYKRKDTKLFCFLVILIIAVLTYVMIYQSIEPIFRMICSDEAQAIATKITNEESTRVMTNYKYSDMFTIEKDEARKDSNDKCQYFCDR